MWIWFLLAYASRVLIVNSYARTQSKVELLSPTIFAELVLTFIILKYQTVDCG